MRKQKATLIFLFILLISIFQSLSPGGAMGAQRKVARVVYITLTSKACSCTLERCQDGDIVVGNVFNGARRSLLRRIDYATDEEAAMVYIKKYRLPQAPALLFLDAQGKLLWKTSGELSEKEIRKELRSLGS